MDVRERQLDQAVPPVLSDIALRPKYDIRLGRRLCPAFRWVRSRNGWELLERHVVVRWRQLDPSLVPSPPAESGRQPKRFRASRINRPVRGSTDLRTIRTE